MDNLKLARKLERQGYSFGYIWNKTKWARGVDAKWRTEIDYGQLNESNLYLASIDNQPIKLSDIFFAPDLYTAYPDMKNISVVIEDEDIDNKYIAMYSPSTDTIHIDKNYLGKVDTGTIREYLIHEIQHAVQLREDFAFGDSFEIFDDKFTKNENGSIEVTPFFINNLKRKEKIIYSLLSSEQKEKFLMLKNSENNMSERDFNRLLGKTLSEDEIDKYVVGVKLNQKLRNSAKIKSITLHSKHTGI